MEADFLRYWESLEEKTGENYKLGAKIRVLKRENGWKMGVLRKKNSCELEEKEKNDPKLGG